MKKTQANGAIKAKDEKLLECENLLLNLDGALNSWLKNTMQKYLQG